MPCGGKKKKKKQVIIQPSARGVCPEQLNKYTPTTTLDTHAGLSAVVFCYIFNVAMLYLFL